MQKCLNVMHISSDYPPHALWGMGVYVEILQRGFTEKYKDVCSCVATTSKSLGENGVCVATKKEDDVALLSQDKTAIFDNYANFILWQDRLADEILKYFKINLPRNTVLHTNNWMSWLTAKKVSKALGLPIVLSVHFLQKQYEIMVENPIPTHHDEIITIENEMLSESDEIICFSDESRKMIREVYGVERGNVSIIPHTSKIRIDGTEEINSTHNVLYLGRLTRDKGILDVIQVVKKLQKKYRDTHLYIIGDGDLYYEIANQKLPFVTLYGYVDDAQKIKDIAKKCSFSLLFSTSDVFPISIVDSMSCGCIPILPNRHTVAYMFEDGVSGFRVNGNIVQNSIRIILDLMSDNNMLVNIRKNVQKYYNNHYSIDTILMSTRKVYETALLDKQNKI